MYLAVPFPRDRTHCLSEPSIITEEESCPTLATTFSKQKLDYPVGTAGPVFRVRSQSDAPTPGPRASSNGELVVFARSGNRMLHRLQLERVPLIFRHELRPRNPA